MFTIESDTTSKLTTWQTCIKHGRTNEKLDNDRERERKSDIERERDIESECVCVGERESENERMRKRERKWMCWSYNIKLHSDIIRDREN